MALFDKGVPNVDKPTALGSPFIDMYINFGAENQEVWSVPYGNLLSFEHKRTSDDSSNSFSISLIGDLDIDLEAKILTGNKRVAFRYGWNTELSDWFSGEVTGIGVKFKDMAMALSITGVSTILGSDTSNRTVVWKAGLKFNKIIDLICTAHGWLKGFIIEANDLTSDVLQEEMSDMYFLSRVLPEYISTKDRGIKNYKLWFTFNGDKIVLNYAPFVYRTGIVKEYLYDLNGTANSKLIDFEVDNLGEIAFSVGSYVGSTFIDEDTGQINYNTTIESGDKVISADDLLAKAGRGVQSPYWNGKGSNVVPHSAGAADLYWEQMAEVNFTGTATLMGEIGLDVGSNIGIVVMLRNGRVHYTSGTYIITEITDTIEGGFTSKVKITRTSANIGDYYSTVSGYVSADTELGRYIAKTGGVSGGSDDE